MKRIWKFVLFGILAAVVVVAADMWLTWRSFSDLDKAVWEEASGESRDVSDIVAQHFAGRLRGRGDGTEKVRICRRELICGSYLSKNAASQTKLDKQPGNRND